MFPLFGSLKSYSVTKLKKDASAGLVVGVMLVPQGMAYAMIAGLPPVYGLYTAILPTVLYTLMGSSRHVSVGPVAMDSLILLAGVRAVATVGTEHYIMVVATLTAIIGMIQLAMGLFRLGFIANFLSRPVILGFTFAAAVVISIKQVRHLLRIDPESTTGIFTEFGYYIFHLDSLHWPTFLLSLGALIVLVLGKRFAPKVPAGLLVVVLGVMLSYLLHFEEMGIGLVGALPSGLPGFSLPNWGILPLREILPLALTLALMGFVEIYSIGKRLQSKHKGEYEIDPNRELIGIGLGNVVGSFFKSFPATAGFGRSAVNESAGAQTGVAAFFSVVVVISALLFLMPVFQYLPNALLGAIIFVAVLGLVDFGLVQSLWNNDKYDFAMLMSSFMATLVLGIEWGIGAGILLSLLVLVYKTSTPHMAVLGKVAGTPYFRNLERFGAAVDVPHVTVLRFDAGLFFANVGALKHRIEELVKQKPGIKKFVLDAQSISDVDSSGMEGLRDVLRDLGERCVEFHIAGIIGPVRDKLFKSGLSGEIGLKNIHDCVEDAVVDHRDKTKLTYQTNVG